MASINKTKEGNWQAVVRRKSIKQIKTFNLKIDAERWAREIESEIDKGIFTSRSEAESTTFAKACERYEKDVLPKLKGIATDKSRLKTLVIHFGKLNLLQLNGTRLASFRDARLTVITIVFRHANSE